MEQIFVEQHSPEAVSLISRAWGHQYFEKRFSRERCHLVRPHLRASRIFRDAISVNLTGAHFSQTVRVEVSAKVVNLRAARFDASASFHVRHAIVRLTDAHLTYPLTISSHRRKFEPEGISLDEGFLQSGDSLGKVVELRGVDAALLVLNDIDLTRCAFEGAYHLDQISLEGRCRFSWPPERLRWGLSGVPVRWWTRRTVLEEERVWRATAPPRSLDREGWGNNSANIDVPDPLDVAATYRQLRKAFEDSLNEPGAADFYYGEMEMRRRDRDGSPASERALLHLYWAVSGYGLRASRAVGWLVVAMSITVVLMMGWGLPEKDAEQRAAGIIAHPGKATSLHIEKTESSLPVSFSKRWTGARLEKAGRVVVNSVIFRSSGQDLTGLGNWIEMGSRFTEPIFLGLAALAVRGRVKRS